MSTRRRRSNPVLVLLSSLISIEYGCTGTADAIDPPPVDPCAAVTCTGHGTCAVTSAALPICACDPDYHAQGPDCVSDANPCAGIDCSLHGTCAVSGESASCDCDAEYHADALACVADPVATAPVVTLSANPTTLDSGGTSTLTWSTTNATSCTASGAWSGSRAVSGSEPTGTITAMSTFTLTCTGPGGSGSRSTSIYLTGAEPFANAIWSLEGTATISRDGADWIGSTDLTNPITTNYPGFFAKTSNIENGSNGVSGYIYTVDPTTDIPWSNVNPSLRAPRVFVFEALPEEAFPRAGVYQTDFYIRSGDVTASDDEVMPASHWLQYWIAMEKTSTSGYPYHGGKLWYPCRDGWGSCHYLSYMHTFGPSSAMCAGASVDTATDGFYHKLVANLAPLYTEASDAIDPDGVSYPGGWGTTDRHKLGTNDPVNGLMHWNEWVLVKTHSYVSGVTVDGDWTYNYEEWWRRYGSPTWHKVMDWRTGEAVCSGSVGPFDWRLSSANGYDGRRGHNVLIFPSTIGHAGGEPSSNMNIYMADIIMATDEAQLPAYTDGQ